MVKASQGKWVRGSDGDPAWQTPDGKLWRRAPDGTSVRVKDKDVVAIALLAEGTPTVMGEDSPPVRRSPAHVLGFVILPILLIMAAIGCVAYLLLSRTSSATPIATKFVEDFKSGNLSQACTLEEPGKIAGCQGDMAALPAGQSVRNIALGSVHQEGTQAILVMTGTACIGEACISNTDANLEFDQGADFGQVWNDANSADAISEAGIFLIPMKQINGIWYTELNVASTTSAIP